MSVMNLREQAAFAYADRVKSEEEWLIGQAIRAVHGVISSRHFANQDLPVEVGAVRPAMVPPQVEIGVDGFAFRVTVKTSTETRSMGSNQGLSFDDTAITVQVLRNGTWRSVETLADIGAVFRDDPLPDPEVPEGASLDEPDPEPQLEPEPQEEF